MKEYHIIVKGLVQGVCFRSLTQNRARKYGIFGSVCNLKDGTVKIIAQGEKNAVFNFLDSLKLDAGLGKIEDLIVSEKDPKATLHSFEIIR